MSLFISSVFTYDEDAGNYIQAVETADAQALEPATRKAINNFVIGCKQDGIWTAIKASCILAGARTRLGALTPLVGTAPTSFNFVDGDYNRKTGLVGNGSTKYLDSNRNNNADPRDNAHVAVAVSTADSRWNTLTAMAYVGSSNEAGTSRLAVGPYGGDIYLNNRAGSYTPGITGASTGFMGTSRSSSTGYDMRVLSANYSRVATSVAPGAQGTAVFAENTNGSIVSRVNARLAFYSIGESLDLALLDARVTDLINAFAVTIP
jgi:hypothetical protein